MLYTTVHRQCRKNNTTVKITYSNPTCQLLVTEEYGTYNDSKKFYNVRTCKQSSGDLWRSEEATRKSGSRPATCRIEEPRSKSPRQCWQSAPDKQGCVSGSGRIRYYLQLRIQIRN
jgi:hypothetical protein